MYNLQELAQFIDAKLIGDADVNVSSVASAISAKTKIQIRPCVYTSWCGYSKS